MSSKFYICNHCGNEMDDYEALVLVPEVHNELDEKPIEWIGQLQCIYCGSDDLEEAEYCEECGELFPLDQLDINWLCPTCAREEAKKHAEL